MVANIQQPICSPNSLKNRYAVMRHGHSLANQQHIIVSHPENGIDNFGLSDLGREQVLTSLDKKLPFDQNTLVVCSDFRRTRETAEIVHRHFACGLALRLEPRLRERDFGYLELGSDAAYADVWAQDAADSTTDYQGVESVNSVATRVSALITDLEREFSGADILLVSHGDALQILQTVFAQQPASSHRSLPHLDTANIRSLTSD